MRCSHALRCCCASVSVQVFILVFYAGHLYGFVFLVLLPIVLWKRARMKWRLEDFERLGRCCRTSCLWELSLYVVILWHCSLALVRRTGGWPVSVADMLTRRTPGAHIGGPVLAVSIASVMLAIFVVGSVLQRLKLLSARCVPPTPVPAASVDGPHGRTLGPC